MDLLQTMRLLTRAHTLAFNYAVAYKPTPMHLYGGITIPDGECGFAWLTVKMNTTENRLLKKAWELSDIPLQLNKSSGGGYMAWIHDFNQSRERKSVYARAFASVLNENGFSVTAESRAD